MRLTSARETVIDENSAEAVNDGKAAYRPGTENEQRETGDQRGDVRVENRVESAVVALEDGGVRCQPLPQLVADALVDQYVGVDRHAQCQGDGGDAGQRQRRLQEGEQGDQEEQVGAQGDDRDEAEQHVVRDHENGDDDKAPERGVETFANVFDAKAGADGAFFDDFHRCGQRTGAQQQGDVACFAGAHAAGNLDAAAADFSADDRRGDDFALAFFDEQDRHPFADVFARDVAEDARAGRIQRQMHGRFLCLVVEAGLGVGQTVAGQDNLLLD